MLNSEECVQLPGWTFVSISSFLSFPDADPCSNNSSHVTGIQSRCLRSSEILLDVHIHIPKFSPRFLSIQKPLHYQQIVNKQGTTTEKAYVGIEPLEQKAAAVLVAHLAPSLDSVAYQLLKQVIKRGFLLLEIQRDNCQRVAESESERAQSAN